MEKKRESKNGIEIMNLLQVLFTIFPEVVKLELVIELFVYLLFDLLL